MIYLATGRPENYEWCELEDEEVVEGNFDEFVHWVANVNVFQLDVETDKVDGPNQHEDRRLHVVQLGDKEKQIQWIFDMPNIGQHWFNVLRKVLGDKGNIFLIHNARFEYTVLKATMNVIVENIHCTYLMSKVLNCGYDLEKGYHSLAGCVKRWFDVDMSKASQTSFNGEPLSLEQILYAATDVVLLYDLFIVLKKGLDRYNLYYLYDTIERHVVKAYGDMELNPMNFDLKHWNTIIEEFVEEQESVVDKLNKEILNDKKLVKYLKTSDTVLNQNLIQPHDELKVRWSSPKQKNLILGKLVTSLPSDVKTKPALKKWKNENEDNIPPGELTILNNYLEREYDKINAVLIAKHKDWLIENDMFVKENTILINWNSYQHKLYTFQFYYPNLEGTGQDILKKYTACKLINVFKDYTGASKRVSSYGKGFLENYVKRDGTVAPFGVNQVLKTGRISLGIFLQMPKENKFRVGFLPPEEDWVFVDADYSSQELVCMAYAAGEEDLLQAIRDGKDAHSLVARLLFPDKWAELAEPECQNLIDGSACKCKAHKEFRGKAKTLNFGIPYGMSVVGLAERLNVDRKEAQAMLDKYFSVFPSLGKMFKDSEEFAIKNHYIKGIGPTYRIRFFHPPEHKGDEGAIGRQAKNFPIQEAGASMTKLALIYLRERIIRDNLPVKLHLPIHDEILASCPASFAEEYKTIQEEEMMRAADVFLEKGLLKADSDIMLKWAKELSNDDKDEVTKFIEYHSNKLAV